MREQQERVIELYKKGVLTKKEAQTCYMELGIENDAVFVTDEEEKTRFSLSLPRLKMFSSTKQSQSFAFQQLSAITIRMRQGKIVFCKHKKEDIVVQLFYPQNINEEHFPQLYVEGERLYFDSYLPCHLTVALPECWLSVLELDVGQADVRLDYLPFEDVFICSQLDKKQQDIRLIPMVEKDQHIRCQLQVAPINVLLTKQQGVRGTFISSTGDIVLNRRNQTSPCFCEKIGKNRLHLQVETLSSPIYLKGVRHASRMVSSTKW